MSDASWIWSSNKVGVDLVYSIKPIGNPVHKMKLTVVLLSTFLVFLLASTNAHAWGQTGHRVVCEIGFQELNDKARSEVVRLMRTDPEFRYFYDSCNWPDRPKRLRGPEHYVNLLRTQTSLDPDAPCGFAASCIITAIMADIRDLSISEADHVKLASLKFLGHWVGDIHQPLHVSFANDRGGNSIKENGPCTGSLHSVWDTCILETSLGLDPLEVAQDLQAEITDEQREAWMNGIQEIDTALVTSWANESFSHAIHPDVEYCVLRDGGCYYSDTLDNLGPHDDERSVRVDGAYMERNRKVVAERLSMAGVRLGALLNAILVD